MAPASVNAELVNCSRGAGGEDTVSLVEVVAVGLLVFSLELPHAAPARQAATSTTASLRTGLVLVQEAGDGCRTFQGERGRNRDEHRRGGGPSRGQRPRDAAQERSTDGRQRLR